MRLRAVIIWLVIIFLVGLAGWWVTRQRRAAVADRSAGLPGADTVSVAASATSLMLAERSIGDSAAPVAIVEFSDFQCPFCRDFWAETMPAMEREYIRTGKVRILFVNMPIDATHPNAREAHEFAMCAARQKRFWPYHDLLFRHQAGWARLESPTAFFRSLADSARLDQTALGECVNSRDVKWLVQGDRDAAWQAGVRSTPSFAINGALLAGHASIEKWRPILDSIYRMSRRGRD